MKIEIKTWKIRSADENKAFGSLGIFMIFFSFFFLFLAFYPKMKRFCFIVFSKCDNSNQCKSNNTFNEFLDEKITKDRNDGKNGKKLCSVAKDEMDMLRWSETVYMIFYFNFSLWPDSFFGHCWWSFYVWLFFPFFTSGISENSRYEMWKRHTTHQFKLKSDPSPI